MPFSTRDEHTRHDLPPGYFLPILDGPPALLRRGWPSRTRYPLQASQAAETPFRRRVKPLAGMGEVTGNGNGANLPDLEDITSPIRPISHMPS